MPTIFNAPSGENDSPAGTEGFPVTGSQWMSLNTVKTWLQGLYDSIYAAISHTHVEADITDLDHTDSSALHSSDFTQDGGVLVGTGAGTYQEEAGATLRTSLGLSIGTDVLAPNGDGSGLSGVVTSETDPVVGAVNGIVKADGAGNISAASAGTDYLTPSGDGSSLTGLTADQVSIADGGGYYSGSDVETALQEIGAGGIGGGSSVGGHLHGLARWVADGSLADFDLPDFAEYIDGVTDDGTESDALDYSLSSDRTKLSFSAAPTVAHVIQAHYVVAQA